MTDTHNLAPVGHNRGPVDGDPLAASLEEEHRDLIANAAAAERAAGKLPKEVKSDEDVNAISAWIDQAKKLDRRIDAKRVEAKEPYLSAGRTVDSFFKAIGATFTSRIAGLEARKKPYLIAKVERERIERERIAAEQRRIAAAAAAQVEAARLEREEAERKKQAALDAIESAKTQSELNEAEARARAATREADESQRREDESGREAVAADKAATREERLLSGDHKLGRVSGEGVTATIKKVWTYRVIDNGAMTRSLGPLAPYLSGDPIIQALARAARAQAVSALEVPGVEFYQDDIAETRSIK